MKRIITTVLLVLAQVSISSAQQTKPGAPAGSRIPTATRLVVTFHDLERQLTIALRKNDAATLDRLLAGEFEVWTPQPPGEPVPRADWLQQRRSVGVPEAFSIRQMAVRGLDDHAVASFVLIEGAGARQTAQFVVDLWARSGGEWKLTDRYASQVPPAPYSGERKPTGKD
ncbi:MAG: nuclear transport factor 2 family protein [Acidobacteriia bacterium]|nr:nuclear transport factor 2 family protein [Terriglobia bacterium]